MTFDPNNYLLKIINLCLKIGTNQVLNNVSFSLQKGESVAITGASGSGKTSLAKIVAGKIRPTSGTVQMPPEMQTIFVGQQDQFMAFSRLPTGYYSQRYEFHAEQASPSVADYLLQVPGLEKGTKEWDGLLSQLHLTHLENRPLLQLSSGERKRAQLAAIIFRKPSLLILDQPFVGLDSEGQHFLGQLIKQLIKQKQSVMLIAHPEQIPHGFHSIIELSCGKISQHAPPQQFIRKREDEISWFEKDDLLPLFRKIGTNANANPFHEAVRMRNITVAHNGKPILKNIDWTIKKGEHWALLGPNGAGKTTLLSLITADHPQGYSSDLMLFGRKRGSGESIWDIKRRIGFVSPELHLYFLRGEGIFNSIPGLHESRHTVYNKLTCLEAIGSGLRDEVGICTPLTAEKATISRLWLQILGMLPFEKAHFHEVPPGMQRLLLIARALVKMPDLLVLDEPCQGLDPHQTKQVVALIDKICTQLGTTMIYVTHLKSEIPPCVDHFFYIENAKSAGTSKEERDHG